MRGGNQWVYVCGKGLCDNFGDRRDRVREEME